MYSFYIQPLVTEEGFEPTPWRDWRGRLLCYSGPGFIWFKSMVHSAWFNELHQAQPLSFKLTVFTLSRVQYVHLTIKNTISYPVYLICILFVTDYLKCTQEITRGERAEREIAPSYRFFIRSQKCMKNIQSYFTFSNFHLSGRWPLLYMCRCEWIV